MKHITPTFPPRDNMSTTYLLKESSNSDIFFLKDDNVKVLMEVQKLGKNNIILVHVTYLLL